MLSRPIVNLNVVETTYLRPRSQPGNFLRTKLIMRSEYFMLHKLYF